MVTIAIDRVTIATVGVTIATLSGLLTIASTVSVTLAALLVLQLPLCQCQYSVSQSPCAVCMDRAASVGKTSATGDHRSKHTHTRLTYGCILLGQDKAVCTFPACMPFYLATDGPTDRYLTRNLRTYLKCCISLAESRDRSVPLLVQSNHLAFPSRSESNCKVASNTLLLVGCQNPPFVVESRFVSTCTWSLEGEFATAWCCQNRTVSIEWMTIVLSKLAWKPFNLHVACLWLACLMPLECWKAVHEWHRKVEIWFISLFVERY